MADFDIDIKLKQAYLDFNQASSLAGKANQKILELTPRIEEAKEYRRNYQIKQEARDNSWAGKTGTLDTAVGNVVNTAASLISGGSRALGHIASIPSLAGAAGNLVNISQEDIDAYNRYKRNEHNNNDLQHLN